MFIGILEKLETHENTNDTTHCWLQFGNEYARNFCAIASEKIQRWAKDLHE